MPAKGAFAFQGEDDLRSLRDELYEGRWDAMALDLVIRLGERPVVHKIFNNIREDLTPVLKGLIEDWSQNPPSADALTVFDQQTLPGLKEHGLTDKLPKGYTTVLNQVRRQVASTLLPSSENNQEDVDKGVAVKKKKNTRKPVKSAKMKTKRKSTSRVGRGASKKQNADNTSKQTGRPANKHSHGKGR